jgi:phenylpyruvate tautomerase PptA (4-oxalocrotonate tautomerase family)
MPFVELFVPRGATSSELRQRIGTRLVHEVMRAEGAPDTPAARSISWLLVREIDDWFIGPAAWSPDQGSRWVVRIGVPQGSLDDEKRRDMVERVTQVIGEAEGSLERLKSEHVAWVHINEIADGNWGSRGRVVRLSDIAAVVREAAPSTVPA